MWAVLGTAAERDLGGGGGGGGGWSQFQRHKKTFTDPWFPENYVLYTMLYNFVLI